MKNWVSKNYKLLIIGAFLVPIFTVALVSISHVTKWYGISNPVSWAIYLSIGIEIAALSTLAAISADMGKKVYFPFGLVTLIQFIGNIYFAYSFIDIDSKSFKDWIELVSPMVEFMGVDNTDLVGHKRFLAFFAGGMLPIISLSFLHMLVKFTEEDRKKSSMVEPVIDIEKISREAAIIEAEKEKTEKYTPTDEELKKIEKIIMEIQNNNVIIKTGETTTHYEDQSQLVDNEKKSITKEESNLNKNIKNIDKENEVEYVNKNSTNSIKSENEIQKFSTIESNQNIKSEKFSTIEDKNDNIFQDNNSESVIEKNINNQGTETLVREESVIEPNIVKTEENIQEPIKNENVSEPTQNIEYEEKKN